MDNPTLIPENTIFNFLEIANPFDETNKNLVSRIQSREIDGFVAKALISEDEVRLVKQFLTNLSSDLYMPTPSGKIFPKPFAVIDNNKENLAQYEAFVQKLEQFKVEKSEIAIIFEKLRAFLAHAASEYKVSTPFLKQDEIPVVAGTFRYLYPNRGGLYVHSGNYFQDQNEAFYSKLKNEVNREAQLSYFIVLQNADEGGELSLYNLIWEKGHSKDNALNNDFIIGGNGSKIMIKDLETVKIRPKEGDILVF